MSSRNNDDLANALNAMMNGEHAEEELDHPEAIQDDAPADPSPAAPAPAAPAPRAVPAPRPAATPKPATPRGATPAPISQAAPSPARPTRPPAPQPQPQPRVTAPAAASTQQTTASAARPARPSRPAAPAAVAAPQAPASAASAEAAPVVDYAKKPKPRKTSTLASLNFRRTLIPPCLVVGVMFPLLSIGFFLQPQTWALRHANLFIPISLGVVGVLVLAVGILNMLMVKKELDVQKAAAGTSRK